MTRGTAWVRKAVLWNANQLNGQKLMTVTFALRDTLPEQDF